MGQYISHDDLKILEDSSYYHFPYSKELELSAWFGYNAKNFDYYNGNRFFKISRKYYPDYTRGILWGYWHNPIISESESESYSDSDDSTVRYSDDSTVRYSEDERVF